MGCRVFFRGVLCDWSSTPAILILHWHWSSVIGVGPVAARRPARTPAAPYPRACTALHVATALSQRAGEPAWHRRQRRRRGDARALLRVAAASRLLSQHHSSPKPTFSSASMGWGSRFSGNDDGWYTVRRGWNRGGGGGGRSSGVDDKLKRENTELRKELNEAKRVASAATDRTLRPSARDSSGRQGDWMCTSCMFRSNRPARAF